MQGLDSWNGSQCSLFFMLSNVTGDFVVLASSLGVESQRSHHKQKVLVCLMCLDTRVLYEPQLLDTENASDAKFARACRIVNSET